MSLASPENVITENVSLKVSTFLITLSPKADITTKTIDDFVKYVKKKSQFAFIVSEVGDNGKKHLHACCVWVAPVEKRNIYDYWAKKMVTEYPGSIGRYAVKVTVQYNHLWYDEYLRKGGHVHFDNYDRDKVAEYFPTDEQQAALVHIKNNPEVRIHLADQILSEWIEKDPSDSSYESAVMFLKYRMHVEKKQPYFLDDRKLHQFCWFLYEHRNELVSLNVSDRNYSSIKTGNAIFVAQDGTKFS